MLPQCLLVQVLTFATFTTVSAVRTVNFWDKMIGKKPFRQRSSFPLQLLPQPSRSMSYGRGGLFLRNPAAMPFSMMDYYSPASQRNPFMRGPRYPEPLLLLDYFHNQAAHNRLNQMNRAGFPVPGQPQAHEMNPAFDHQHGRGHGMHDNNIDPQARSRNRTEELGHYPNSNNAYIDNMVYHPESGHHQGDVRGPDKMWQDKNNFHVDTKTNNYQLDFQQAQPLVKGTNPADFTADITLSINGELQNLDKNNNVTVT